MKCLCPRTLLLIALLGLVPPLAAEEEGVIVEEIPGGVYDSPPESYKPDGSSGAPVVTFKAPGAGSAGRSLEAEVNALKSKVQALEDQLARLAEKVAAMDRAGAAGGVGGGGGSPRGGPSSRGSKAQIEKLEKKVDALARKYEAHSHDYLLEARSNTGETVSVGQGEMGRSGLSATGRVRIGKPK